jgi:hypothetical protein
MRRILLGAVAVVAVVVVAAGTWVFAGERLALFFDRFTTVRLASLPMRPLSAHNGEEGTYYPGVFLVGKQELATANLPEYKAFPLTLREDERNRLALVTDGKSFRLGPLSATTRDDVGRVIFSFEPEQQDKASFTLEKSLITWLTPFETNFMTGGPVASWRRFLTYRLTWRKPSGAELEMVWRYRQDFIAPRGWVDVFTGVGSAGLIKVRIKN